MGGTPVFVGTRVPLQNLIDYLEGGESIEDFLDGFPGVRPEQVIAVIEAASSRCWQRSEMRILIDEGRAPGRGAGLSRWPAARATGAEIGHQG
jgi:uncharacterized protein (DUF433 family)